MRYYRATQQAFSLIELLIVIALIGIVSAMAFPAYQHYLLRANRTSATTALIDLSARMQHYFLQHNHYTGATLALLGVPPSTENHLYLRQITVQSPTRYLLAALPQGKQTADTDCATFTYNELGQRGITGEGTAKQCWG